MLKIIIYTDGSCNRISKLGGLAYRLEFRNDKELISLKEFSKGYCKTTIDRMELKSMIFALQEIKLKSAYPIQLICDRQNLINSINKYWVLRWEELNWIDRLNSDLWKQFLIEWRKFPNTRIQFIHTRGHGKGDKQWIEGNNRVDELCNYKNFTSYEKDEY